MGAAIRDSFPFNVTSTHPESTRPSSRVPPSWLCPGKVAAIASSTTASTWRVGSFSLRSPPQSGLAAKLSNSLKINHVVHVDLIYTTRSMTSMLAPRHGQWLGMR
ncbi:hypothetical protein FA13DRAFT_1410527 [Coprinellus micaceus]|uniref:Uncharacterized protein n=1 Tax=Coprinellus micaceus TaxID=71717 RepID=A0A4Y7SNS6_COPMI|nr:hypothetical protein FA13DRAFT_1410527 [Coprinellus micaceus]